MIDIYCCLHGSLIAKLLILRAPSTLERGSEAVLGPNMMFFLFFFYSLALKNKPTKKNAKKSDLGHQAAPLIDPQK